MSDPWMSARDRLNQYVSLDPVLRARMAELSADQAHNDKLAFALESGRSYPMRQEYYNMRLKQQLDRQHPGTETAW